MRSLVRRMAEGFRYALAMRTAQNLAAQRKFENAKLPLTRFFSSFGAPGPSTNVPVEANIMFAGLCQWTDHQHAAYEACHVAIEQIKTDKCVVELSGEDKEYLLFHCKWKLSLITNFIDSVAFQDAVQTGVRYADLNLRRVSPRLRRRFPITEDAGRALDQYFEENEAELARG